jgi:hypothetical protein
MWGYFLGGVFKGRFKNEKDKKADEIEKKNRK